jgi:hypothetical protein
MYALTDTQAAGLLGAPVASSVPSVPPLPTVDLEDIQFSNGNVQLDGLKCKKCMFEKVKFEYSGGLYSLERAEWKRGTIQVEFKGCALNALKTVQLAAMLTAPAAPKAVPQKPKPKEYQIKTDMNADWVVK